MDPESAKHNLVFIATNQIVGDDRGKSTHMQGSGSLWRWCCLVGTMRGMKRNGDCPVPLDSQSVGRATFHFRALPKIQAGIGGIYWREGRLHLPKES